MSAEAVGWVLRHSPYTGALFAVHFCIADSVNDQNDNQLWMSMGNLASKARVGRKRASEAVATMLADGFLGLVEDHRHDKAGEPSCYRFQFPACPVVHETRAKRVRPQDTPPASPGHTRRGLRTHGVSPQDTQTQVTQEEPKGTTPSAPEAPGGALFDLRSPPAPLPPDPVVAIFDAWRTSVGRNGRTALDARRRRLIEKALEAYPATDVTDAVRGWEHSAFHRGHNERRRAYNDLALLLRDAEHIERFRDLARGPREPDPAPRAREHVQTDRSVKTGRIQAP